eukprot:3036943-Rhodomonas_salina.1
MALHWHHWYYCRVQPRSGPGEVYEEMPIVGLYSGVGSVPVHRNTAPHKTAIEVLRWARAELENPRMH